MAHVFISHATQDQAVAVRVRSWLRDAGHSVFLDCDLEDGLRVGDGWAQRLYAELYRADALVAIVTTHYRDSPWCAAEVGIARANGVRLLPVRSEAGVSHRLISSETQWAELVGDGDRARSDLVGALRRLDGTGSWSAGGSVYPGLRAFDASQARIFFGRADDSRRLAERLRAPVGSSEVAGLLAVVGPSGCGKSSVVRAGLAPLLADEPDWLVVPPLIPADDPDADPVAALARLLAAEGRRHGMEWTAEHLEAELGRPRGLAQVVADLLARAAPARRLLLVVDQAEELLTRTAAPARQRFAALLREGTDGPVRAVATMRSEFLDRFSTVAADSELPMSCHLLAPLARGMLPLVITGPARRAGIRVDDELVARMVADTGGGDALPLLAFVLNRVAMGVSRGEALSAELYEALGGVRGALVGQADAALKAAATITGRDEADVLLVLLRLVTVGDDGQVSRRRMQVSSLPGDVRAELNAFVERRLLTVADEPGDGRIAADASGAVLDLAHEQILTAWPPLAAAIDAKKDLLRLRGSAADAADDWSRQGRPADHLWELGRATTAANALDPADVTPVMHEFLLASRRRGQVRRRRTIAVLVAALLLVTGGAAAALVQRGQALDERQQAVRQREQALNQQRLATARGLAAQAEQLRDHDPLRALRLNLAAERLASNPDTRAGLATTLADTRWMANLDDADSVEGVAFRHDGRLLATLTNPDAEGGRLRLWDVTNPRRPVNASTVSLDGKQGATAVAFSRDGRLLATTLGNGLGDPAGGRLRLWDVTNPRRPLPVASVADDQDVTALAFSPDGRLLATTTARSLDGSAGGGRLRLWDVTNPRNPVTTATVTEDENMTSVAFSPDGRTIATTSRGGRRPGRLTLWNARNPRRPIRTGSVNEGNELVSVVFSPDRRTLATINFNYGLRLWNVADRRPPTRLAAIDQDESVTAAAFSPDGRSLATTIGNSGGAVDGRLRIWDITDRHAPSRTTSVDNDQFLTAVAYSPDGRTLATTSLSLHPIGGRLRLWDVPGPHGPVRTTTVEDDGDLRAVAFGPSGHALATSTRLWTVADRGELSQPARIDDTQIVSAVTFSPDGHTLATTTGRGDATAGGRLELWDLTGSRGLTRVATIADDQNVTSVAFSPDGRTLATGTSGGDGAATGRLRLWDLTGRHDLTRVASIDDDQNVTAVAFSPDSHTLATATGSFTGDEGGGGGRLRLWDVTDRRAPTRTAGIDDDQNVTAVAFSPDGRALATTTDSDGAGVVGGRLRLWDITDRHAPTRTASIDNDFAFTAVAFSPDGQTVAATIDSGGGGSELSLWSITWTAAETGHIHAWACAAAGGGLSARDWATAAPGIAFKTTCPD